MNPGKTSEDKFKSISAAYEILSDPKKRSEYDTEYERIQIASFAEKFSERLSAQFKKSNARKTSASSSAKSVKPSKGNSLAWIKIAKSGIKSNLNKVSSLFKSKKRGSNMGIASVSIIEISVTVREAIFGQKKTIEIPQTEGKRKVSVTIPPGVKSGSVLRLKQSAKNSKNDEIIVIIRVAQHPFVSLQNKGVVIEVPITALEALGGANITLPTLDEPAVVKVPAGSQSGSEIRLKNKGVLSKDGTRGDLIYRLMIKLPQSSSAVGIKEKATELDKYYEEPVRRSFPSNFSEI